MLRKYKGRMQGFSHALCFLLSCVFRLFARYLTWLHWLHLRLPRERNSWVKRLESVGEGFSRCQLCAQPSDTPPALLGQKSKLNNKHYTRVRICLVLTDRFVTPSTQYPPSWLRLVKCPLNASLVFSFSDNLNCLSGISRLCS